MLDIEKFIAGLHDYLERALSPLSERIKALEDRPPVAGKDGRDGKDFDPELIKLAAAETLPPLVEGAQAMLKEHIDKFLASVPVPSDGAPGKDADEDAIASRVLASVESAVSKAVSAMPIPRDGRDGQPGVPGAPGADGSDGACGRDGERGLDGLGFDDLSVQFDGERTAVIRFARGEVVKEFPIRFPVVLDRGVHKAGTEYQQGDGVTLQGSFWIAQKDAPAGKPGEPDSGWRLAVKAGRPGKDGDRGQEGRSGLKGLDGRNYDGTRAT